MVTYIGVAAGAVIGYLVAVFFFPAPPEQGLPKGRVFAAVAGGLIGFMFAGATTPLAWTEGVVHVEAAAELDQLLETSGDTPVLVSFYADWCPPCRQTSPGVNALADAGHRVAVVDVDRHPDLAEAYGVAGIPTLLVFRNGSVADRAMGYHSEENLRALLGVEPG